MKTKYTASPADTQLLKMLPQAVELEKSVLGTIMISQDAFTEASELLTEDCFYLDDHKTVFRAMCALSSKNRPLDALSVTAELEGKISAAFLAGLQNAVASPAHLTNHCRVIVERFTKRELIRAGSEIMSEGYDPSQDAFELLDRLEKKVVDIRGKSEKRNYRPLDAILVDSFRHTESIRHREESLTGVPSGFIELDRVTCGFQATDLIIMAARPSVGKTAFALNLMRNAAETHPVGFFSLEMSEMQLVQRLESSESGIYLWNIRNGKLDDGQMQHLFEKGLKPLAKAKAFIDDTPAIKLSELKSKARRMVTKEGVKMIIIDYLQLMTPDEKQSRKDLEIGSISAGLKGLAKELRVPVIALSQLSRSVEQRGGDGEPKLSDLRESGAIEQDADLVFFLWKPTAREISEDPSLIGFVNIKIEKNRNGTLETFVGKFVKETQKFESLKVVDKDFQPLGTNWRPVQDYQGDNPF